jgi:hypothetical protein
MANLPWFVAGAAVGAVLLHALLRNPVCSALLIVGGDGSFGLPLQGRFDLRLGARTRFARSWADLVFSDCPRSRFLILSDQLPEPDWRRLCLILKEGA